MTGAEPEHVHIAIAGAGLSGLGMAIALHENGVEDFVVLERASELGGTWRDNSYPGCACDIPSYLYCYRDEPNPEWTRAYAGQTEIWDYMRRVAERHGVTGKIRCGHDVTSARWDPDSRRWAIETAGGRLTADVVVSAVGALADPAIPQLPGLETFAGHVFHSARWDHDHDLRGRRVAVVGTGASAIQFVPEIQPIVGQLDLFQRTPPWVLPRSNPRIPAGWRRALRRYPRLLHAARAAVFSVQEALHVMFRHPRAMHVVQRRAAKHIAREIPDPELAARLTPDYSLGCKRVLGSDSWYPALRQPNVDVVTCGLQRVEPEGIVDGDGVLHPVDTIIFGTGFQVTDPPIGHRVHGRDGRTLAETWNGSMRAHLGIGVAGFPNLFMLLGPNTGLGHNSVLLMIESQIDYIRKALAHRERLGAAALEPTAAAQAAFAAEVDRATEGTVWTNGGCSSWYVDRTGRNSTLWPRSVRAYERRVAHFNPAEWVADLPAPATEPIPEPALA